MNPFNLKNKKIIITGGLGFLGIEFVKAIHYAEGIPIVIDIHDRIPNDLKNIITTDNIFIADICDEDQVRNTASIILEKFNSIDGLINNAANNPKVEESNIKDYKLESFSMNIWEDDLNVSLKGSYLCTKHFGTIITENKHGGSIINISSDLGIIAPNQNIYKKKNIDEKAQFVKPVTYSVVKHGIIGLTKYTSTYWAKKSVRCNAICPGGVLNGQDDEFLKKVSELIPLGRMANKEELHGIIIYLLSDVSSYMTGSIISIDGGRTVW